MCTKSVNSCQRKHDDTHVEKVKRAFTEEKMVFLSTAKKSRLGKYLEVRLDTAMTKDAFEKANPNPVGGRGLDDDVQNKTQQEWQEIFPSLQVGTIPDQLNKSRRRERLSNKLSLCVLHAELSLHILNYMSVVANGGCGIFAQIESMDKKTDVFRVGTRGVKTLSLRFLLFV
jgi:hypothetical protein